MNTTAGTQAIATDPGHRASSVLPRTELVARYATLAVISLGAVQAVYATRGLYADGAYYLWRIIEARSFYIFASRASTQFITQLPVVLAIRFGITNVSVLARLQSLGTAALPMAIWATTLLLLRRHRLFWPFVAIFAVTFLNSGFFSVGEYNFASALVSLSAAILLTGDLKPWACATLLLISAVLPLSYESLAWLGPLLAVLAMARLRVIGRAWRQHSLEAGTLAGATLFYLVAAVLNVSWTVAPPYPTDLAPVTLAQWMWPIFNDRQLVLSGTIATLYIFCWGFGGRAAQRVAATVALGASGTLLIPSLWNTPWMQYASRGVTAVALFALLGITALGEARLRRSAQGCRRKGGELPRAHPRAYWLVGCVLLFVQLLPFSLHTYGWTQWLSAFDSTVTTSHGILTNDATVLHFKDSSLYVWPWTDPLLSVLLHTARGQAVILSPGQSATGRVSIPASLPKGFHMDGPLFKGW